MKHYTRKDFLKVSSLATLALVLEACGVSTEEAQKTSAGKPLADSLPKDLAVSESENVIYIRKTDTRYEALNQGFNKRLHQEPAVIALCKNTDGVAEAVLYARQHQLQVAIKSGGHSFEGFSSNNGGLVINLSLLNSVTWIDDTTVQVGPGCKLSELYGALLPKQRLIPAGSCAGVGVGGLTLGGGYGFFSRKYGLTCDSLRKLTLVDGNGNIRSSDEEPDLLWACKGAGNGNFGVVTELVFDTKPAPPTFTSTRFKAAKLDAARAAALLEAWFAMTAQLPESCFSAFVLNGKSLTILLTDYDNNAPLLSKLGEPLAALCDKYTPGAPVPLAKALPVFYGIQHPVYFKNASAGLYKNFEEIRPYISEVLEKVIQGPGLIYQVNTLGGAIANAELEKASAYAHRQLPYLSELQAYWEKPESENRFVSAFQEVQDIFAREGMKAQYINYPSLQFAGWEDAYYGSNYEKLQRIKETYDPDNVFRHQQSITRRKSES